VLEREELKKELVTLQDRMEALEEGDWDEEVYSDDDFYTGEAEYVGEEPSPVPQKVDNTPLVTLPLIAESSDLSVDVGEKEDEVITPIIFNKAALETIGAMQLQILSKRYPNLSFTEMVGDEAEDLIDQAVFLSPGNTTDDPI
jgi:hypothetical protein